MPDDALEEGHPVMRSGDATTSRSRVRAAFDWVFRSRETGAYTVVQLPNPPLWIFLAATAVRLVFSPSGTVGTAVGLVATAALGWWAVDEVVRGVNPWRRALGAFVLVVVLAGLIAG